MQSTHAEDAEYAEQFTLDQQIVLLTLDPRGAFRERHKTEFAAAGGVLVELALRGRIGVVDGRIVLLDGSLFGQLPLDAALERIAGRGKPQSTKRWVRELRKLAFENAVAGLTEQGLLRGEWHRALGMVPLQRYPRTGEAAERAEHAVRDRLAGVVLGGAEPDERTACLGILADAARLHRWAFPQADAREVAECARQLAGADWAGPVSPEVRGHLRAVRSEAAVAVTAGAAGAGAPTTAAD